MSVAWVIIETILIYLRRIHGSPHVGSRPLFHIRIRKLVQRHRGLVSNDAHLPGPQRIIDIQQIFPLHQLTAVHRPGMVLKNLPKPHSAQLLQICFVLPPAGIRHQQHPAVLLRDSFTVVLQHRPCVIYSRPAGASLICPFPLPFHHDFPPI